MHVLLLTRSVLHIHRLVGWPTMWVSLVSITPFAVLFHCHSCTLTRTVRAVRDWLKLHLAKFLPRMCINPLELFIL